MWAFVTVVNFTAVTFRLFPAEIGVAHQLQGGLLLGDLDVLHELPFGLVARNLHDGDGRDPARYMFVAPLRRAVWVFTRSHFSTSRLFFSPFSM